MKFSDLIYVLATVIAAPFAYADDASDLNNLQRQIEAAKTAKKSKPAASAPAKHAPEIIRQDADALRLANLTVQSDASCILSVNGEKKTTLSAGVSSVKVPSGKSLVTCRSTDNASIEFSGEVSARAGENSILRIELAGPIADAARKAEEARVRQMREDAEREAKRIAADRREAACKGKPWLMEEAGRGVLRQCETELLWAQSDNGSPINWRDANRYCQGNWRLPTRNELKSLYGGAETIICWEYYSELRGYSTTTKCRVSSKFELTGIRFWTNERNGSSEAWKVGLYDGTGGEFSSGLEDDIEPSRALCVRRP